MKVLISIIVLLSAVNSFAGSAVGFSNDALAVDMMSGKFEAGWTIVDAKGNEFLYIAVVGQGDLHQTEDGKCQATITYVEHSHATDETGVLKSMLTTSYYVVKSITPTESCMIDTATSGKRLITGIYR